MSSRELNLIEGNNVPKAHAIRTALSRAAKVLLWCFAAVLALILLIVGTVTVVGWWEYSQLPEFRGGVRVRADRARFVRRDLLSPPVPTEIGYAETGDGCHIASGALLLRSHRVRRVLTTIDAPVCGERDADKVLQSIPDHRLPTRARFETSAFWLERIESGVDQGEGGSIVPAIESESAGGPVRIVAGDPWPHGFLINCSRDSGRYSLRARLPDPLFGGSRFGEIAGVGFWRGTCMDERHWPKIEALIDLIWSLEDYRSGGT